MPSVAKPELLEDAHWLFREYMVRKRSVAQIAAKTHCGREPVAIAIEAAGFELRQPPPPAKEIVHSGPVDCTPFPSRNVPAPVTGRCRCERPLVDADGLCCKCGK